MNWHVRIYCLPIRRLECLHLHIEIGPLCLCRLLRMKEAPHA